MLNLGEIIINHNGDHSVINYLTNNVQNKTSATKKKRSRTLELQNLLKRFLYRATRKVLSESNLQYSLLTSNLEDFVNTNQISHRDPYDYSNCNWQTPSTGEIYVIYTSPSREEFFRKLFKAKNTSPGKDKLEYIHII